MFAKDNSSLYGTGTKKGKEVSLRKSDRRNLRNKMYETLLLPKQEYDNNNNNDNGNNIDNNDNKSLLHRVIDDICLQGSNIVQRQLVYTPDYKKVTVYMKSPSSSETNTDADAFIAWPFTIHSQAIWMELDVSVSEKALQVPTVALLSVLHAAAVVQQEQQQQQPLHVLLPTIAIPSAVSKNLCRGAHLMRAGIFSMPYPPLRVAAAAAARLLQMAPPKQTRLVALVVQAAQDDDNDDDNDDAKNLLLHQQQQPFAVGLLHPAIQSVQDIGPGTKGVGVEILTCYGDDFWRLQQQATTTTSSSSRTITTSSGNIVSPTGGAPFDAGHYGNVGFVNGAYVVPIVVVVEKTREIKEKNGTSPAALSAAAPDVAAVEPKTTWDNNGAVNDAVDASINKDSERGNDNNDDDDYDDDATTKQQDNEDAAVAAINGDIETRNAEDTSTTNVNMTTCTTPDEVLHESVCRALVALHPAKRFLPMPMSTFYANHVLKHKPPGTSIELKKTRYKKFGAYIQEQVSRKLVEAGPPVRTTSGSGGNNNNSDPLAMLTGYDRRHDDLKSFIQQAKESASTAADQSNDDGNSLQRRLVLVDLYRVPSHFVSLLRLDQEAVNAAQAASVERRNTGYLTGKEVREILEHYIARENLVDTINKGCVHLDGPLTDALFPTSKKQSKANTNNDNNAVSSSPSSSPPATLSRKDLVAKWQLQMQDAYALVQMPGNVIIQMNRGKPPQVTITVTKRQNRKFVTRVRGVEHYGINALHFKNDVSHRLACAASIDDSPTEKLHNKDHVELVFQGNIHEELQALLLSDSSLSSHGGLGDSDYQLPKNCIHVTLRKGVPGQKK